MTVFVKTNSNTFINLDRIERFYFSEYSELCWLTAELTKIPEHARSTCCKEHAPNTAADGYDIFSVTEDEKKLPLEALLNNAGVLENF